MSAYGSLEMAIEAIRRGARDYLSKPFQPQELLLKVRRLIEEERLREENLRLQRELAGRWSFGSIIGRSAAMERVFDQVAAVIKSGGKTRRAAKMQSLKVRHPDIMEFITCKVKEEKKAWALIEEGYDGSFNGEAYESVFFQNANLSIRVTDEFMESAEKDGTWTTTTVKTEEPCETFQARDILQAMAVQQSPLLDWAV